MKKLKLLYLLSKLNLTQKKLETYKALQNTRNKFLTEFNFVYGALFNDVDNSANW